MADGRLFTDYRPRCDVNLTSETAGFSAQERRMFMIHNADELIKKQRVAAFEHAYCGPCVEPYDQGTQLQERDRFRCDAVSCVRVPGDPTGLGTGRDYGMLPSHEAELQRFLKAQEQRQRELRSGIKNDCSCPGGGPASRVPDGYRAAVPGGGAPFDD